MPTLEVLIAQTIFTLSLAAVVMLAFGNQSVALDAELSRTALSIAGGMLEGERAAAREDFRLVVPTSTAVAAGPLVYRAEIAVSQTGLAAKQATSTVSWENGGRTKSVTLSTLFTDPSALYDTDTCSSLVTEDWTRATPATSAFLSLIGTTTGPYPISDVDAYHGKLYVTVAKTPYKTDPTLFIFDVTHPTSPVLLGSLDNTSNLAGLAAVRVAEDPASHKVYAFTANGVTTGQLQIFDVTNAAAPSLIKTYTAPSGGKGNAIAYRDGYVYLGLTASSGDEEFHVIDVYDPAVPPVRKGGYAFGGHGVNAISLRGDYAYVATPADEEVIVLRITDPALPVRVGGFNASVGAGGGKSVYAVGTTLALGKAMPVPNDAGLDYYTLDISDPQAIQSANASAPAKEVNSSVNRIIMRDFLSFLLTNDAFITINATSTAGVVVVPLPPSSNEYYEPSMDCEGSAFYVGSNDSSGIGSLSVITAPAL